MKQSIFCGCSYTKGAGLEKENHDENLWVNLLHSDIPTLKNTILVNVANDGNTNQDIFLSAIEAIANASTLCQYLFVCWTEIHRYKINPGVEQWPTNMLWCGTKTFYGVNVNPKINYSTKYIENIKNRYTDLRHPHYEIMEVLNFSKIIQKLARQFNIKTFFINCLLPWDLNFFVHVKNPNRLPNVTTSYTQKILNLETRDDDDFWFVYDKIHQDYAQTENDKNIWLNLYDSYRKKFYVDQGNDKLHPGINSNRKFANFLEKKIIDLL